MSTTAERRRAGLAAMLACAGAAACGGDAPTWLDVVADSPVDHAVLVRGPFADGHDKVTVTGPVGLVASGPNRDGAGPCYTVYTAAGHEATTGGRTVVVGAAAVPLRLGPAEFLLVPAKRLVEGRTAAEAPRGVFQAYPILDPPDAIAGPAGRPTHLCLPVDYRHHFERVPVDDAERGLLIFASRETDESPDALLLVADDFGFARLRPGRTCRDVAWVAVRPSAPR